MFLLDDSSKPTTPTQTWIKYLVGFGLSLLTFHYGAAWLRKEALPQRVKLPYALKEWSADDEFYREDELHLQVLWSPYVGKMATSVSASYYQNPGHSAQAMVTQHTTPQLHMYH